MRTSRMDVVDPKTLKRVGSIEVLRPLAGSRADVEKLNALVKDGVLPQSDGTLPTAK